MGGEMIDKLTIKALGQTIEHNGKVVLVVDEMLVDCMVLFISMDEWHKIKDTIQNRIAKGEQPPRI